jgi:hypothetical protein
MSLVRETDGEYLVRADLPAVDVSVRIDNGVAALAGERRFEEAEQSEKVYRRESLRSTFSPKLAVQDEDGQTPASREHEDRGLARAASFERDLLKPVAASDLSKRLKMPGRPAR